MDTDESYVFRKQIILVWDTFLEGNDFIVIKNLFQSIKF